MIAEEMTTKAIARALQISVKTVETHRTRLMDRLDIRDVASLVRYAIRSGIIKDDPEPLADRAAIADDDPDRPITRPGEPDGPCPTRSPAASSPV